MRSASAGSPSRWMTPKRSMAPPELMASRSLPPTPIRWPPPPVSRSRECARSPTPRRRIPSLRTLRAPAPPRELPRTAPAFPCSPAPNSRPPRSPWSTAWLPRDEIAGAQERLRRCPDSASRLLQDVDAAGRAQADDVGQPDGGSFDLPVAGFAPQVVGNFPDVGDAGGGDGMALGLEPTGDVDRGGPVPPGGAG